jgi:hypothetical protein
MPSCTVCDHGFSEDEMGETELIAHLGTHPGRTPEQLDAAYRAFERLAEHANISVALRTQELDAIPRITEGMGADERARVKTQREAAQAYLKDALHQAAETQTGWNAVGTQINEAAGEPTDAEDDGE